MPPIALTKAGRAKKKCKACILSAESTFSSPIPLTQQRSEQLAALAGQYLQHSINHWQTSFTPLPALQIKALNASRELETCLLAAGLRGAIKWTAEYPSQQEQQLSGHDSSTCTAQQAAADVATISTATANTEDQQIADDESYVAILQACQLPSECNLLVVELQRGAQHLAYVERCTAAFALLSCVPIVFVAQEWCPALREAADSPAGKIWGVCSSYLDLEQRLRGDLPRGDLQKAAALRQALLAEITALIAPYRTVNKPLHFAKRGAVALVPFGVHTVNAMGLVRLAKQVLRVTGMGSSKQAKRAVTKQAGSAGVKVTAIDSMSDVYQFIVQGSIITEAVQAAAGAANVAAGAAAAIDTITLLDAVTLGTVCVFTGMVSAWGAAQCRPSTVDGMARVIAAQQLVAAVQPSMRQVTGSVEIDSTDDHGASCSYSSNQNSSGSWVGNVLSGGSSRSKKPGVSKFAATSHEL